MKTYILFILIIWPVILGAQTKEDIIKNILKNEAKYRNQHSEFEEWFKFQSSEDTGYSRVNSKIASTLKVPALGISETYRNHDTVFTAMNLNELTEMNSSSHVYYTMTKSKYGSEEMARNLKKAIFKPLTFTKKDYSAYKLTPDTNSLYFVLCKDDTSYDKVDTIIFHSLVYVRKTDFLPCIYYGWAYFGGGVQYSKQKLNSIEPLTNYKFKKFYKQVDSLSAVLRTYYSGDSIQKLFQAKYKNLKVGDSCLAINGRIHQSNDSLNLFQNGDSILILDFSYTTCGWCIYSIPALNNLFKQYDSTGVGVYSLDPIKSDWPRIDKFISYYKVQYPIVKISRDYSFEYGIHAFPTLLIIKNGILIYMHVGYSEKMEEEVTLEIKKAMGIK